MGERRISDAELVEEVRRLARELEATPTAEDMKDRGRYAYGTYRRRFGGWNAALEKAGFRKNRNIPKHELLTGLLEFTADVGGVPTQDEMDAKGPYSVWSYKDRFGSWSNAKAEAGLREQAVTKWSRTSDSEIIEELQRVGDEVGGPPTATDLERHSDISPSLLDKRFGGRMTACRVAGFDVDDPSKPIPALVLLIELRGLADELGYTPTTEDVEEQGVFSVTPYERCFGSFGAALNQAGLDPNHRPPGEGAIETECTECGATIHRPVSQIPPSGNVFCGRECYLEFKSRYYSGQNHWAWEGHDDGYGPNWQRTREEVLGRDDHECQKCGISESEHREEYSAGLSIHHIRPRSAFDDLREADEMENLVTLCKSCHLTIERARRGG